MYSNYVEQNHDEVLTLLTKLGGINTPILMGDFSHGPAIPRRNVVYRIPYTYGLMTARGLVSPYVMRNGRCTICTDNPIIARSLSDVSTPSVWTTLHMDHNYVTDHIYVSLDAVYEGRVISAEVQSS